MLCITLHIAVTSNEGNAHQVQNGSAHEFQLQMELELSPGIASRG